MIRVLKPNGFISVVPIWYKEKPNISIINKVNNELGFKIKCYYEKDWMNFENKKLELYYKKDYYFIFCSKEKIKNYVNTVIDSKEHLKIYNTEEIKVIKERWSNTISVFNDNLSMTNYSIILLRKTMKEEEMEIFLTEEK